MTRWAHLWGGPEDGERIELPDGDLPPRIGVHRTGDGLLVPMHTRSPVLLMLADHVYEHAGMDVLRAFAGWRGHVGDGTDVPLARWSGDAGALYVHRDLVTRWLAAAG